MIPKELLKKVRQIQIRTSRTVNDVLAGQYHSAFRGRGMEFEEVAPYQIGDDVRLIDWNVSARYGEPFIKKFREELAAMGIVVHGINYKDTEEGAIGFLEELGDPFTRIGADRSGRVGIDWGVYGVPETFVIDGEGRIIYKHIGPITGDDLPKKILPAVEKAKAGG